MGGNYQCFFMQSIDSSVKCRIIRFNKYLNKTLLMCRKFIDYHSNYEGVIELIFSVSSTKIFYVAHNDSCQSTSKQL